MAANDATNNESSSFFPQMLQIEQTSSGTLSSFSSDGADLISFPSHEDATCATELSSRPPSATSFLLDDIADSTSLNTKPAKSRSVHVTVSETSYSVPRDVLVKMTKLTWISDNDKNWRLNTSPAIFEILLGHFLFDTLPAIDTLSKAEYDEFEPMALSLGLYKLVEHFDRSSDKRLRRNKIRRSSLKQQKKATSIVLNGENVSRTAVKLMNANNKCARLVASLKRKSSGRFRARRAKATHEQCCLTNSEHIN